MYSGARRIPRGTRAGRETRQNPPRRVRVTGFVTRGRVSSIGGTGNPCYTLLGRHLLPNSSILTLVNLLIELKAAAPDVSSFSKTTVSVENTAKRPKIL